MAGKIGSGFLILGPFMNIVTIPAQFIAKETLEERRLDSTQKHGKSMGIKVVDVEVDHLGTFIADLKETIYTKELRSSIKALK
jgi:hypothetical protein